MADAKRPQLEKFITPRGVAVYPKLSTPDEYKGKLSYKTGLRLPLSVAQPLIDKVTAMAEAYVVTTKAELTTKMNEEKGAKKVALKAKIDEIKLHLPFKRDVNDEGEPVDTVVFNFKMNAEYVKDGKTKKLKPTLVDAKGNVIPKEKVLDVWGGSEIKVEGFFLPTYVDASGTCGITFRLKAVQIIELRTGGGGHGFGAEEGGFDASGLANDDVGGTELAEDGDAF